MHKKNSEKTFRIYVSEGQQFSVKIILLIHNKAVVDTRPKLSLPGSIFRFQLPVNVLKILTEHLSTATQWNSLSFCKNIFFFFVGNGDATSRFLYIEAGNYYSKSTFIMTLNPPTTAEL